MLVRVSRWGNSLAIRLPKAAAASLNVQEGQAVDLTIEGDKVVIRPRRPPTPLKNWWRGCGPAVIPNLSTT